MSTIKLPELLYRATRTNTPEEMEFAPNVKVNMRGAAGICSIARPESAIGNAKYSTLFKVIAYFFNPKSKIRLLESSSAVYTSFEYKEKVYEVVFDGIEMKWTGEVAPGFLQLIPVFAYTLSNLYDAKEVKDELKGCIELIEKLQKEKKSITYETQIQKALLMLCDSFYYGYAKENNILASIEYGITKEQCNASIESGLFNVIEPLSFCQNSDPVETASGEESPKTESFKIKYSDWTEEQKLNIPPESLLDTFIMTNTALSIAKKIKYRMDKCVGRMKKGKTGLDAIGSDYINLLMVGRPSTGKTTIANAVAAMTGMPIYTIPISKNTEEDTIEGKNKVVDGKIDFVETDFLKAYQNGGIVVLEEINLADPGVIMGSLGQAIEKPFIVMKDGYIPVKRHPLCVVIATMNTGTAGSRQLNQALSSRFKSTYVLDDPDKNTFIDILAANGYGKRTCQYVFNAYTKICTYLKDPSQSQEELCDNLTLRGCLGALEAIEEGQNAKEALRNTLIGKIAEVDLEVARAVNDNVINSLPELVTKRSSSML